MLKRLNVVLVYVRENLRSDVVLFYLTYVSRRTSSGEASELGGTPEQAISKLDDCVFIDEIASYIEILGFDIDRSRAGPPRNCI